jgi:hypothetical protein
MIDITQFKNKGLGLLLDDEQVNLQKKSKDLKTQSEKINNMRSRLDELKTSRLMPREERDKINKEKRMIRSEINKEEKVLNKLKSESKDLLIDEEIKKCENLSGSIDWKGKKNFSEMDPITFSDIQNKIKFKAKQIFKPKSKSAYNGILKISEVAENSPYFRGCSKMVKSYSQEIENALNDVFVDMAENQVNVTKYINPYVGLGIALGLPIGLCVLNNTILLSHEKKKSTNQNINMQEKILNSSGKKDNSLTGSSNKISQKLG